MCPKAISLEHATGRKSTQLFEFCRLKQICDQKRFILEQMKESDYNLVCEYY